MPAPNTGISHRANRKTAHCLGADVRVLINCMAGLPPSNGPEPPIGSNIASMAAACTLRLDHQGLRHTEEWEQFAEADLRGLQGTIQGSRIVVGVKV